MARYFLEIAFNGKSYYGWQRQPDQVTVQELLEKALSDLLATKTAITGAGRTDTGVHALQLFAHFDWSGDALPKTELEQLIYRLNAYLEEGIAIKGIFRVSEDAHARFHAIARTYIYRISLDKNPFTANLAWYHKKPLDMAAMNSAAKILLEYTDFECFSKSNTDVKTYLCKITEAHWKQSGGELVFTITADRFLRNMVRAIVGTLVEIGLGKMEVEDIHAVIKSKDRGEAGPSVPAHGLCLNQVTYPKNIFL